MDNQIPFNPNSNNSNNEEGKNPLFNPDGSVNFDAYMEIIRKAEARESDRKTAEVVGRQISDFENEGKVKYILIHKEYYQDENFEKIVRKENYTKRSFDKAVESVHLEISDVFGDCFTDSGIPVPPSSPYFMKNVTDEEILQDGWMYADDTEEATFDRRIPYVRLTDRKSNTFLEIYLGFVYLDR